jgi:hypothetical protein
MSAAGEITLPLDRVEEAADALCEARCHREPVLTPGVTGQVSVEHRPVCLVPLLEVRRA